MPHHQLFPRLGRHAAKLLGMRDLKRDGLFDKNVFAAQERFFSEFVMKRRRQSDHDGIHPVVLQNVFQPTVRANGRIYFPKNFERFRARVANGFEHAETAEMPDVVLSPKARPTDCDGRFIF
jgi:hypothetical protein